MGQHPIEELMKTAMESIKEMVDVNTIVGDAVQTVDGTVIIPVSKVAFGFAAGGGEYSKDRKSESSIFPFAGGSGAGVSINPVAFMVVGRNNTIKMIPASPQAALDRALDNIPNIIEQVKKAFEPGCKHDKDQKKHDKPEDKDKAAADFETENLHHKDIDEKT
ncbi:MAG: GerW family sporulation protein [Acetivibrionales bacterium]|nr:sporulation protein YtfJ [Clostridiaceae bacterium]